MLSSRLGEWGIYLFVINFAIRQRFGFHHTLRFSLILAPISIIRIPDLPLIGEMILRSVVVLVPSCRPKTDTFSALQRKCSFGAFMPFAAE